MAYTVHIDQENMWPRFWSRLSGFNNVMKYTRIFF